MFIKLPSGRRFLLTNITSVSPILELSGELAMAVYTTGGQSFSLTGKDVGFLDSYLNSIEIKPAEQGCPDCDGRGQVGGQVCATCGGEG